MIYIYVKLELSFYVGLHDDIWVVWYFKKCVINVCVWIENPQLVDIEHLNNVE